MTRSSAIFAPQTGSHPFGLRCLTPQSPSALYSPVGSCSHTHAALPVHLPRETFEGSQHLCSPFMVAAEPGIGRTVEAGHPAGSNYVPVTFSPFVSGLFWESRYWGNRHLRELYRQIIKTLKPKEDTKSYVGSNTRMLPAPQNSEDLAASK